MSEKFKTKVRSVGTSLGVLLPKEIAKEMKVKEGESIEISIIKKDKEMIRSMFGKAKGASRFVRDHKDRF